MPAPLCEWIAVTSRHDCTLFFIFLIFPNIIRFDEKHSKRMDSFSLFLFLFALFVLLHDRQRCNLIQTFIELFWTFAIWKLRKHCNWEFSLQINLFQLILEWNQSFFFLMIFKHKLILYHFISELQVSSYEVSHNLPYTNLVIKRFSK